MSNINITNGVTIEVEDTEQRYHTWDTWKFYITNTDCIGEPIQQTNYVTIPFSNVQLDLSEALTGFPVYKSREIKIELAGLRNKYEWDAFVSSIRNAIDGRICRITFDNDRAYFWRGRVHVTGFSNIINLGKFTISIPECEPYKYNTLSSSEPWKWDPFNFVTGVITNTDAEHIVGSGDVTIPAGNMYVSPELIVSNLVSPSFTVEFNGKTFELKLGSNKNPEIQINGRKEEVLHFTGTADVLIVYRGGSL